MMLTKEGALHDAITAAGVPLLGVSILRADDKSTWRINFAKSATLAQKATAQQIVDAFDMNAPLTVPVQARLATLAGMVGLTVDELKSELKAK